MLKLAIKTGELYDSKSKTFLPEFTVVELEHSLASLSKWESIWEKPFLSPEEPSTEETLSYIHCMCVDPDTPPELLWKLDEANVEAINKYINKKSTATTIREPNQGPSRSVITSEQIYSWMSGFQIPLEAQHWHLNRLIMLIKVCNANNQAEQKATTPTRDDLAARREENERRKREWNSRG